MTAAPFEGFRAGGLPATLPAQFFVEVMPHIEDEAELRVTLYALYAIARERGQPRAVRASRLAAEEPLLRALAPHGGAGALRPALEAAARRGVLLACPLDDGDTLYFVNTHAGRRQRDRVLAGALPPPGDGRVRPLRDLPPVRTRPAQVYEDEIGPLSPSVTAALAEAEARYPEAWIVDALRAAAARNARSWRYAEAILRRWESEGRDDEATGRPAGRPAHDPYAHLIRRSYE